MDQHSCAVQWLPLLLTEQARSTRGVQAAVESHRNEATKSAAELNEKLAGAGAFMGMVDAVARQSAQLPPAAARAILPYVDNE